METESLKALAFKVLRGNQRGKSEETSSFQGGNSENPPERTGKLVAIRIYSHILDAFLWVVADDQQADILRASGEAKEPIYTMVEARELKKLKKVDLPPVHLIKSVFPEARVEAVLNRNTP